jgi:hypothetical protein
MSYQIAKKHGPTLTSIITGPDCALASAMLQLIESQEFSRAIVHVFMSSHCINSLLNNCYHREIKKTSTETTLFRTDSPATRTSIVFFKLEDARARWLANAVLPSVLKVIQNPSGYEVDPEKKKEDKASIAANAKNLLATAQLFLDAIIGSLDSCPYSIRYTTNYFFDIVSV